MGSSCTRRAGGGTCSSRTRRRTAASACSPRPRRRATGRARSSRRRRAKDRTTSCHSALGKLHVVQQAVRAVLVRGAHTQHRVLQQAVLTVLVRGVLVQQRAELQTVRRVNARGALCSAGSLRALVQHHVLQQAECAGSRCARRARSALRPAAESSRTGYARPTAHHAAGSSHSDLEPPRAV